ncbi:MAG: ATP-binding protein [Bacteroides sp.]
MRKKENRLFREKKDHEQQMYEDKVKFLINLSHELRTPLTLIYGPIKHLLSLPHPPEDLNNQLTSILRQTKQMKNTIDMVLDVRRMELGYEKLQLVTVHLEAVIREIANDFLNECKARNIVLTVENESQIDFIDLDATKFNVILSNLLSNAIKFSPSEGLIRITMQQENEMVRISVIDQGPGLKDVDLSKLFVRFYQGNHKQSGSGIGLSYSKLLIEMHGGTIEATDQEPTGAKFSFTLPLQAKEGSVLSSQPYLNKILPNQDTFKPEISREITVDTTHYSLLIVENNIEMSDFMRIALTEHFQHIFTAQNGEEALQLVNTHKPDVIVSDLSIPQMNGYELCRVIKSNIQTAHIPFILLSECTDNESVSIGYHLGADAYLPKPFEIELLLALIMKQISNREMLRQRYSGIQAIEGPLNNADEMFLLKFNQIIMHHIADSTLDIQKLCELMGMSRSALYNKVKVLTNMSTKEYLNKARINKATVLLTTTSLSIAEISESLGYIYPRYFSGVFRQYMGVLPSKYRHDAKTEI